ncbi:c-type cytochrome [Luteolibacter algae]|uniref:C-type cytochrome n=1 Tax=Luteolibacter algae TaxID=454151 RepID=A0ABW5DB98_9BACT
MSSNNPQSNPKPDLDESINVTQAHGRVVRESAASAREKRIADNGHEPASLGIIVACGIVLLIAGGVLDNAGVPFKYGDTFREGYVREKAPGGGDEEPLPKPALAAFSARGAKIYSKCNGCHGADGKGDGANYPSLAGSEYVLGDTEKFAMIILNGIQGPISTGKTYGAGIMPAQGTGMSADDLAGVMTYVRNSFGNSSGDVVTVEMAQKALEISAARENPNTPVTADEIAAKHMAMLPGEPLDPTTPVNPVNLQPVE